MKAAVAPKREPDLIDLAALAKAAECLRTLAHPHRLRMVQMLLHDRYTVGELADACAIPSHMASGHLRLMQRCGLLSQEREGRRTYYRVAEPCLADVLACVRNRFAGDEG
jgi:DNA-binding transcriptional ArsR family regulator